MTSSYYDRLAALARRVVDSRPFRVTIVAVILFAGVETNAAVVTEYRALLKWIDAAVLAVFVVEILLKLVARGRRPLDYFRDGWNVFDFAVVVVCLLPVGGPFATVLRLVRTLRLLRLVSALPKLQLLVGALLKSLSAMGYVSLLLALIFYIYAVAGIHLFGRHAPEQFGNLPVALLSLFQMITLDAWSDLFHAACAGGPLAATIYFVSFILLGTMIMLNLFIGVIMSSMAEMHAELEAHERERNSIHRPTPLHTHFTEVERHLGELRRALLAKHPGSIPDHTPNGAGEDSLRRSPTGVMPEHAS